MKPLTTIIIRLIALPFYAALGLVWTTVLWIRFMKNFVLYGGECISYTKKGMGKTIADVFEKLEKMQQP